MAELKPIRSNEDYESALKLFSELWGAKDGTPEGDQLDILATLIDAYENEHFPMSEPSSEAMAAFRAEQENRLAPDMGNLESEYVFEVFKRLDEKFAFRLKEQNGEIILISEVFSSKADALKAIEVLRKRVSGSRIVELAA